MLAAAHDKQLVPVWSCQQMRRERETGRERGERERERERERESEREREGGRESIKQNKRERVCGGSSMLATAQRQV